MKIRFIGCMAALVICISIFEVLQAEPGRSEKANGHKLKLKIMNLRQLQSDKAPTALQISGKGSNVPVPLQLRVEINRVLPTLYSGHNSQLRPVCLSSTLHFIRDKDFQIELLNAFQDAAVPARYCISIYPDKRQSPGIKNKLGPALSELGADNSFWLANKAEAMKLIQHEIENGNGIITEINRIATEFHERFQKSPPAKADLEVWRKDFKEKHYNILTKMRSDVSCQSQEKVMREAFELIFMRISELVNKWDSLNNAFKPQNKVTGGEPQPYPDANIVDFRTQMSKCQVDFCKSIALNLIFHLQEVMENCESTYRTSNNTPDIQNRPVAFERDWQEFSILVSAIWKDFQSRYDGDFVNQVREEISQCTDPSKKAPENREEVGAFLAVLNKNGLTGRMDEYLSAVRACVLGFQAWAGQPEKKALLEEALQNKTQATALHGKILKMLLTHNEPGADK
ncbi:hypothetical protein ACFL54_06450 [Planctomycetota bacterium]